MATKKTEKKVDKRTVECGSNSIKIEREVVTIYAIGDTPFICNRLSEKGARELLFPHGKKNDAEKAANLKHDPVLEFRRSIYAHRDEAAATYIYHTAMAIKGMMRATTMDFGGAKGTEVGRLTQMMEGPDGCIRGRFSIYGVPEMLMAIVRMNDKARTPDVRTRAIVPNWGFCANVMITRPKIGAKYTAELIAAGGIMQGLGDWRQGKGSGDFGLFHLVNPSDQEWKDLVRTGGRNQQHEAMQAARPKAYDEMTEELFTWFLEEIERREMQKRLGSKVKNVGEENGVVFDNDPDEASDEQLEG
jgi:hypothetical protein